MGGSLPKPPVCSSVKKDQAHSLCDKLFSTTLMCWSRCKACVLLTQFPAVSQEVCFPSEQEEVFLEGGELIPFPSRGGFHCLCAPVNSEVFGKCPDSVPSVHVLVSTVPPPLFSCLRAGGQD